jgi:CHASE2 domain-containing sensor protein
MKKALSLAGLVVISICCIYAIGYATMLQNNKWYGFPNFLVALFVLVVCLIAICRTIVNGI